jgi:hypothetical protein
MPKTIPNPHEGYRPVVGIGDAPSLTNRGNTFDRISVRGGERRNQPAIYSP